MARKRASRRLAKKTRKATGQRKTVPKKKPAKRNPARKKPGSKRRLAKKKHRLRRATGGERAMPRKLADTDQQIETFRHHVSEQCVSIASSIDTIPPEMISAETRDRWLRGVRQAAVALVPVIERLAGGPPAEAEAMIAAIYARKSTE
jgi:hypothetical protein